MNKLFSASATVFCLVILLASCKKSTGNLNDNNNTNSGYYICFKANGIKQEFKSFPIAQTSYNSDKKVYVTGLLAYKDSAITDENLVNIVIMSATTLTAGATYKDPLKTVAGTNKVPQVIITYDDAQKKAFLSMGLFADESGNFSVFVPDYDKLVADANVTITEVTSTYVKGTFSGTVFNLDNNSYVVSKMPLTDGEFYLQYLH